jgi:hypothetical protein
MLDRAAVLGIMTEEGPFLLLLTFQLVMLDKPIRNRRITYKLLRIEQL